MNTVSLPSTVETFHRGFDEVLRPFLSNGNPIMIMGLMVYFYKAELHYNFDRLDPKAAKMENPFICIVGNRTGNFSEQKCQDPRQPKQPFGYEHREQIFRSVYVGFPRAMTVVQPPYSDPTNTHQASMMDAERLWSQLFLVLDHQHKNFNARGIFNPRLPAIPAQVPHLDYILVRGELQMEIRFRLTRNNTFSGE